MDNPLFFADAYKLSHWQQYPPNTKTVFSYLSARKPGARVPFLGMSYFLQRYLEDTFHQITRFKIFRAAQRMKRVFNTAAPLAPGWEELIQRPLPVRIRAVPEGTVVPSGNVLMTIENTDTRFPWLTNFIETCLLQLWYPSSVGAISLAAKTVIAENLKATGTPSEVGYKLHDFGMRACSCMEQAQIGGFAHLVFFDGSDNLAAMDLVERYYQGTVGMSVPASEHSTMTAWGQEREVDAYANMLQVYPDCPVSVVSDSWDVYAACVQHFGTTLKDKILKRKHPLIVRPDSGDPVEVVLKVTQCLADAFGTETNNKGYRVLPKQVRILQGDGMSYDMICELLNAYKSNGWSGDNIAFGMGGNLLQNVTRDKFGFAFKCSSINDGTERDVFKAPVTDPGKHSFRGRIKLVREGKNWRTVAQSAPGSDMLVTYYDNGIKRWDSFEDIRKRANDS